MNEDTTKDEMRRQIFYDPPTIEEALKNFMSWFVAEHHQTPQEVLRMTRLLSKCINQHYVVSSNTFVASIWNPVEQDEHRKVTQTLGRVALQAVWHQLDTSSLLASTAQQEEEDIMKSFLSSFEVLLFASSEQDSNARLIWNTDRGKEELMRRAVQRQAEAARRSADEAAQLPRIEEIHEADEAVSQG